MKHIKQISKESPAVASDLQELICVMSKVAHEALDAKGGSLPIVDFFYDKCGWDQVQS